MQERRSLKSGSAKNIPKLFQVKKYPLQRAQTGLVRGSTFCESTRTRGRSSRINMNNQEEVNNKEAYEKLTKRLFGNIATYIAPIAITNQD